MSSSDAASLVLAAHMGVIAFNVFGLIAIPVGGWLHWRWVRTFWWRALHVASLGVVALQAVLGRACFLTLWQSDLAATRSSPTPLIMRWVDRIIFWPLPMWFFALLYLAVLAAVIALWRLVPPRRARGRNRGAAAS